MKKKNIFVKRNHPSLVIKSLGLVKSESLDLVRLEEDDEKYIPKKKSGGKKVIIEDESEEKYVPKKNVNKKDNLI